MYPLHWHEIIIERSRVRIFVHMLPVRRSLMVIVKELGFWPVARAIPPATVTPDS